MYLAGLGCVGYLVCPVLPAHGLTLVAEKVIAVLPPEAIGTALGYLEALLGTTVRLDSCHDLLSLVCVGNAAIQDVVLGALSCYWLAALAGFASLAFS